MKTVIAIILLSFTASASRANMHVPEPAPDSTYSSRISVDSANRMLSSYIRSRQSDADLYSLIINADTLRSYLNDTTAGVIKEVKLMFAHRMDYINKGNDGIPCGLGNYGLTLIIAGYDENGDYVLINGNSVLDNCAPCPATCPTLSGNASENLLP